MNDNYNYGFGDIMVEPQITPTEFSLAAYMLSGEKVLLAIFGVPVGIHDGKVWVTRGGVGVQVDADALKKR